MSNSATTSIKPSTEPAPVRSAAARVLVRVLRTYQYLSAGRVSPCRFHPSCSNYALEAIELHGGVRGSAFALRRLSRCRPFGPHGIDLVPEPKSARSSSSCTQ